MLAFGTLAAIAFELIKGQIGLMIAVIFILIGLILGVKNANLALKIGWVHYYSRIIATPEIDDPNFFEKQKENLTKHERKI